MSKQDYRYIKKLRSKRFTCRITIASLGFCAVIPFCASWISIRYHRHQLNFYRFMIHLYFLNIVPALQSAPHTFRLLFKTQRVIPIWRQCKTSHFCFRGVSLWSIFGEMVDWTKKRIFVFTHTLDNVNEPSKFGRLFFAFSYT